MVLSMGIYDVEMLVILFLVIVDNMFPKWDRVDE